MNFFCLGYSYITCIILLTLFDPRSSLGVQLLMIFLHLNGNQANKIRVSYLFSISQGWKPYQNYFNDDSWGHSHFCCLEYYSNGIFSLFELSYFSLSLSLSLSLSSSLCYFGVFVFPCKIAAFVWIT